MDGKPEKLPLIQSESGQQALARGNALRRWIFPVVLLFAILTRFPMLGSKPFHHDESLFAYYGWSLSQGQYTQHEPLLHGPLQLQVLGGIFALGRVLGILGNGDAAARLFSAFCGIAIFLVAWSLRREIRFEGVFLLLLWLAVSPGIWYYSRFTRNEMPFLLASLGLAIAISRGWSNRNPSGPIVLALVLTSLLICMKENSLFLIFDGLTFFGFVCLFDLLHLRRERAMSRPAIWIELKQSLQRYRYAWFIGAALGYILLEVVYTNGFQWGGGFIGQYADIMRYWWGQHREHRLFGEFHYYLPIFLLYETAVFIVLAGAIGWAVFRRSSIKPAAMLLLSIVLGFWGGIVADRYMVARWDFSILHFMHMSHAWHLALAGGVGWITLWLAWECLGREKRFRAWLIWWAGLSYLQYSYAGEKVPWLALHFILPAMVLAADLAGEWWVNTRHRFSLQQAAVILMTLTWTFNLLQGGRMCLLQPTNPGELMIYNHTQQPIADIGHAMRQRLEETDGQSLPFIEGAATWPLVWYIHGHSYVSDVRQVRYPDIHYVVCDLEYLRTNPHLQRRFDFTVEPLRTAFVPEHMPLYLFRRAPRESGIERGVYGAAAWKTLARYIWDRQPWQVAYTAMPYTVQVGRLRSEDSDTYFPLLAP